MLKNEKSPFHVLLHMLAELNADPEQSQTVIEAFQQQQAAQTEPTERGEFETPNCAEPTEHVPLGKKHMPKYKIPQSLNQKGHLRTYGKVWYGLYRRPQFVKGGIKLRLKKVRLGPISEMSHEEAKRKLGRLVSSVGTPDAPSDSITIREFYEQHFLPEFMTKKSKAFQRQSRSVFKNYVLGSIGDEPIKDFSLSKGQQLCDLTFAAGVTVTAEKVKRAMTGLFKRAIAHGIIDRNPATEIVLSKMIHKALRAPTLEQAQALVAALVDSSCEPCREMALLACSTSTNSAEMAGLLWRRVNLTDKTVVVEGKNLPPYSLAIWNNYTRGSWEPTKAKARYRILPLGETLVAMLSELRARREFNGPDDTVFGISGKPIGYDVSLRKLKKAGKKAGVEFSWHDLRRFFANIADEFGMRLEDRQYMMGHGKASMTDHYTTTPEIERKRPFVERITRALLGLDR